MGKMSGQSPPWPTPRANADLPAEGSVHVWVARLDPPADVLAGFEATLSAAERERAGRFHFARHREAFIAARGLLRLLLARCLQLPPAQIEFVLGRHGKPALAQGAQDWQFNLAHCESMGLIAVSRAGAVGVDLEQIQPVPDAEALVARFFSPRENEAFQRVPPTERGLAFFNLWTRKEAWLKATGEGITHLLNQVEVGFLPGEPARLLKLPTGYSTGIWTLRELAPAPGYAAALAVACTEPVVWCWNWAPQNDTAEMLLQSPLNQACRNQARVHAAELNLEPRKLQR